MLRDGGVVVPDPSLQIFVRCFLCLLTCPIRAFHLIGDTFGGTFSEFDRHFTRIYTAINQWIPFICQRLRTSCLNGRLPFGNVWSNCAAGQHQTESCIDPFHSIDSVADSSLAQSSFSDSRMIPVTIF